MKKILVLSAMLLGTVASRAGVDVRIGFPLPPLPPLPNIVIGAPAPRIVVREPRVVCSPAPIVVAPPRVCAPPPVVVMPRRHVVYAPHYSHRYEHRHYHHHW